MLYLSCILAVIIAAPFLASYLMKRIYLQMWHKAQDKGCAAEFEHLVRFNRPRYPGHILNLYHEAIQRTVISDKTE